MKKLLSLILFSAFATLMVAQTYEVETIHESPAGSKGLNIVVLSEGYTANQMSRFRRESEALADSFFSHRPWKEYKDYINFYRVPVASNKTGAGLTPDKPIDNVYGTCFGTSGVDRMPWPTNWNKVYEVLNATVPSHDMVIIFINMNKYGGGGGSGFVCMSNFRSGYWVNDYFQTMIHEAGHALGDLADEYWYDGRERPNQTKVSDPERVKWKNWLDLDGIGIYPYEESPSWYRPHQNCQMRYLGQRYCNVCLEALVEKIHEKVSPLIGYEPGNKTRINMDPSTEQATFKLHLITPNPNSIKVIWKIDGQTIEGQEDTLFTVDFSTLENPSSTHLLTARIEDQSPYLLVDNHDKKHYTTVTWRFSKEEETDAIQVVEAEEDEFIVHPLPFSDHLTVERRNSNESFSTRIIDMEGKILSEATGHETVTINTNDLPRGIYIVQTVVRGQVVISQKVMKVF